MQRGLSASRRATHRYLPMVVGVALAASGGAEGSTVPKDPDPDFSLEDTVKLGPFHAAPFILLKDLGYDDNIRLTPDGRQTGDYSVTIGPGVRAVVPFGHRAALASWNELDYVAYATQKDLNTVNGEFRGKLHYYLRDFIVFADGRFRSYRERPDDEIDFRMRHDTGNTRVGLIWRPTARGRIDFYKENTRENYTASSEPDVPEDFSGDLAAEAGKRRAEALDREEDYVWVDGRLKIRPRTSVLLDFQRGRMDYDEDDTNRDSAVVASTTGIEFDPSGPLRGFVRLGVKDLEPDDPRLEGYSGMIGRAQLFWKALERALVKLNYKRDAVVSVLGENLYYLTDSKGLGYEHFFTRRISVELARNIADNSYPTELSDLSSCTGTGSGLVCDEKLREDRITTDTFTVRYAMRPGMKIGLAFRRWDRESNFDLEDVTRNTVYTTVEYVP